MERFFFWSIECVVWWVIVLICCGALHNVWLLLIFSPVNNLLCKCIIFDMLLVSKTSETNGFVSELKRLMVLSLSWRDLWFCLWVEETYGFVFELKRLMVLSLSWRDLWFCLWVEMFVVFNFFIRLFLTCVYFYNWSS